jgi:diguanylate cyclase (GGDEF)-like protein
MDKVFPKFISLGRIEPSHHRFFLVLNHCAVLGLVVHTLLIPVFILVGCGVLASLNVASAMLWAGALFLNRHGRHNLALALVYGEVLTHSIVAVTEIGWASGFQYYLLLAPPMLFFSHLKTREKLALMALAGMTLVGLQLVGSFLPPVHNISPGLLALLSIGNLTTAFVVLAFLIYYYHYIAVRAESAMMRTNDELARLASTDPLTGLINRRKMVEELNREVERFMRSYQSFAILLADMDDFKLVNDRFGHEAGDHVLQQLALLMGRLTRQVDRVARWGGEEFMLLLPGTDRPGALRVAEKLRDAVASHPFFYNGERLVPTITVGVAIFEPGEQVDRCILRADHALYRGKQQGKNRVVPA